MRIESEQLHYRTRFELCPYDTTTPAIVPALRIIYRWVYEKERKSDTAVFEVLRSSEGQSAFLSDCFAYPHDYNGGINTSDEAYLCVRVLSARSGSGVEAWAMEYDEPDARFRYRHWHTRIGLSTTADGTCIVNAKVTFYTLPGYFGLCDLEPHANVPRFIKDIIRLNEYQSCIGETVAHSDALRLTANNFTSEFTENLLSSDREIPIVLIASDRDGKMPLKEVSKLAYSLTGLANVYLLDRTKRGLNRALRKLLEGPGVHPGWRLRGGRLRIFPPRCDLSSAECAHASRFYSEKDIARWPDGEAGFTDMLNRSFARSYLKTDDDVLELADIDLRVQRRASERARASILELKRRLADAQRREADAGSPGGAGGEGTDAARRTAAMEKATEKLRARLAETEELVGLYEAENDGLMSENRSLSARVQSLEDDVSRLEQLRYRCNEAERREAEKDVQISRLKEDAAAIAHIDHFPTTLVEELDLIERLWPDRVAVLPEARRSAEAYRYCNLDEEWRILRSVATDLWEILFDSGCDEDTIDKEYRARTGFAHTFRESKQTNANPKLVKMRERVWNGRTVDITPHIKGRGRSESARTHPFRLHYYADRETQKVVIGHCGDHMDTAGTQRMG